MNDNGRRGLTADESRRTHGRISEFIGLARGSAEGIKFGGSVAGSNGTPLYSDSFNRETNEETNGETNRETSGETNEETHSLRRSSSFLIHSIVAVNSLL